MNKGDSEKWVNPNDKLTNLELLEKVMYGDNPTGEQDQAYEDLKKRLNTLQSLIPQHISKEVENKDNIFDLFKSIRESVKDKSLYEKVCLFNMKYFMFSSEEITEFKQLVERATQLDNIMNTAVEFLSDEEYNIRNAYIYIKEALDWSNE